jgi:hypothetical protein
MSTRDKGVRAKQKQMALSAALDRRRGLTWGQLSLKYKVDRASIRRRVIKHFLATQEEAYN